LNRDFKSSKIY